MFVIANAAMISNGFLAIDPLEIQEDNLELKTGCRHRLFDRIPIWQHTLTSNMPPRWWVLKTASFEQVERCHTLQMSLSVRPPRLSLWICFLWKRFSKSAWRTAGKKSCGESLRQFFFLIEEFNKLKFILVLIILILVLKVFLWHA